MVGQRDVPSDGPTGVRSRFASIAVSAIVHASAIVWLAGSIVHSPFPAMSAVMSEPAHAPSVVPAPQDPAPLTVDIIELDQGPIPETPPPVAPSAASPPAHATARARPRGDHGGVASSSIAVVAPDAAPAVTHPPGGEAGTSSADAHGAPSTLTMRHPNIDRGLSPEFVDNLSKHTKESPPPPPDINTAAHADDQKIAELEHKLANPRYHAIATSEEIENAKVDLQSLLRERDNLTMAPIGGGRYRNREESFTIDIEPDGTVAIKDKPGFVFEGLGGRFDITDMIMRARGEDPYAWAKLHFLDKTRDERAAIGRVYRSAQLGRSAQLMLANIDRLWAMTRDPRARRDGLFELWDDCAETGDAELLAGADAARLMVIVEIRARLHGADAYTADELARLNAHRTSIAPFAPYSELATRPPARGLD
jgi:hypothetical protein